VTDPNILCLPRDWNEFDIEDADGNQVDIDDGLEISLSPRNKTSPEVVQIAITWDGFDIQDKPIKFTIDAKVHRDESPTQQLVRWIEHFKRRPDTAEIASQLFTNENEYYWKDQTNLETAQQVSFTLKPWTTKNTEERQRIRPKPPPADVQDPLGPFSHYATPSAPTASTAGTGREAPVADSATDQAQDQDRRGQYQYHSRKLSTHMVNVTLEAGGDAHAIKVHPKEVEKDLVHEVARQFPIDLLGYWHPRVISGTGDVCRHQEGDVIRLFAATEESLETVREPRTA
jgi:hypothetical protein